MNLFQYLKQEDDSKEFEIKNVVIDMSQLLTPSYVLKNRRLRNAPVTISITSKMIPASWEYAIRNHPHCNAYKEIFEKASFDKSIFDYKTGTITIYLKPEKDMKDNMDNQQLSQGINNIISSDATFTVEDLKAAISVITDDAKVYIRTSDNRFISVNSVGFIKTGEDDFIIFLESSTTSE